MPRYFKQDHTLPQGFSDTFRERFWKKINKDGPIPPHMPHLGPCWIWVGATNGAGCGHLGIGGGDSGNIKASRAMWLLVHGKLPEQWLLHRCDNPICVRPEHLFEGTPADNTADMFAKGRQGARDGFPGERNPNCKLTEESVAYILHAADLTRVLADMFGISIDTVRDIRNRNTWKHLRLEMLKN